MRGLVGSGNQRDERCRKGSVSCSSRDQRKRSVFASIARCSVLLALSRGVERCKAFPTTVPRLRPIKTTSTTTTTTTTPFRPRPTALLLSADAACSHAAVRSVFLRGLGLVCASAFTAAWRQNKALIGDGGITPARRVLDDADARAETSSLSSERAPLRRDSAGRPIVTVLWWARNRKRMNPALDAVALTGLSAAVALLVTGRANVLILLLLWTCQRSLMAVGGVWYGYGWEPQLAECIFHALFIGVPLFALSSNRHPVPKVTVWTMRWFLFRIMMGAGLIKIKSRDSKWKISGGLTTMKYFYETQPVPNPFSKYLHAAPLLWHRFEVLVNHFVELVVPFFLLVPLRSVRVKAGVLQLIFQAVLICSGNLSFLNWLTMLPALFCLDDAFLAKRIPFLFSASLSSLSTLPLSTLSVATSVAFGILVAVLSVPVVRNLLSPQQRMNSSFDPLRLVNSYGAFGVVHEERVELIVSSAADVAGGEWREYEFKVKPGDPNRAPKWISPYHHRLDWQMWIASVVGSPWSGTNRWIPKFLYKLLQEDEDTLGLLESDPWRGDERRPKYAKIDRYAYRFNRSSEKDENGHVPYWIREYKGRFYPTQGIASLKTLEEFVADDDLR